MFENVAIIGAGLCGLTLSIALQHNGFKCTVYETRAENGSSTPGAVSLSPNALRSLDAIGIYDRVKSLGYRFRNGVFRTNDHTFIKELEAGDEEQYGYDALRIHRQALLDELRSMAQHAGVLLRYGKKFSSVISDNDSGVRFRCANGDEHTADILIGADGIHSTVRRHLFPDVETVFSNAMSIITAVPTSAVKFPYDSYELPVSIHGDAGAFILAPQGTGGEELLLAIQHRTHERDRAGWNALLSDKQQLFRLMKQNYDQWNTSIQSALDAVNPADIFVWAFYSVPKLPTWKSRSGRVVILGDAAHAIPPSAGQGINQGFEDVHSLALLMTATKNGSIDWDTCLEWWQKYRQVRVDRVTELTDEMTRRRLPGWKGDGAESIDNSWLYGVQIEDDVRKWLASHKG